MTQSDDSSGRDSSCESICIENKINAQQSLIIETGESESNRGEDPEGLAENGKLRPKESLPSLENFSEMGSTDSAGNTHSGSSSCGLVSSLFPNSCRGRAESFARRLHRRLTSLGGEGVTTSEDEEDETINFGKRGGSSSKVIEASWLHSPTGQRIITTTKIPGPVNSSTPLTSSCNLQMDERVLNTQPRHSPESDVYYDFDLEPYQSVGQTEDEDFDYENDQNVTNSPAEIANDADVANILVNKKIATCNHNEARSAAQEAPRPPEYLCDSESGCVFESPLPGTSPETDNSEVFFDPLSSETDKTSENRDNEEIEYDRRRSEDETIASRFDASEEIGSCNTNKHPLRRRIPRVLPSDKRQSDDDNTSESSSSSFNLDSNVVHSRTPGMPCTISSEESLNGNKSSLETVTSPSHESLWSTFDESTLSLQDESSSAALPIPRQSCQQNKLPKSHSDSEIVGNKSKPKDVDEVDHASAIRPMTNGLSEETMELENNRSTYCSSIDIPGALTLECPSGRRIATLGEELKNQVNLRIEETNGSDQDAALLLTRSPCDDKIDTTKSLAGSIDDKEKQTKLNGTITKDDRVERSEKNNETTKGGDEEEEEDDEENNRPQRLRRCSSLKSGKTPPGTPGRKKIVRFADVLGLDLADVRTFLDEIPKIPNSAYSDLIYDEAFQKDSSPVNFWGTGPATFTTPLYAATMPRGAVNGVKLDKILVPLFQQPGGSPTFLDVVRERQVCLENIVVQDPINLCLHGTVRVRNLDFHKSVHIRYTLDSWRSFSDLQAVYVKNSCDGFSDKFTFLVYCHTLKVGQRLELAVRFQCKGCQYWDNNGGSNYCFQCLPSTSANSGYIPITTPTITTTTASPPMSQSNNHDWLPTFY